jgi:hypothetical protein
MKSLLLACSLFLVGCQCDFTVPTEYKSDLSHQYDVLHGYYRCKDIEKLERTLAADTWLLKQAIECEALLSPQDYATLEDRIRIINAMVRLLKTNNN